MRSESIFRSEPGTSDSDLKREKNLFTGNPARRLVDATLGGVPDLSPATYSGFSMVTA